MINGDLTCPHARHNMLIKVIAVPLPVPAINSQVHGDDEPGPEHRQTAQHDAGRVHKLPDAICEEQVCATDFNSREIVVGLFSSVPPDREHEKRDDENERLPDLPEKKRWHEGQMRRNMFVAPRSRCFF